ncbi:hypothetical protein [Sulfurospirillum multivorans]|uniref:Uncharacterized protein n=1 Tax=Sulfurospirillum multivorans (strain DM 12446 / JCM 15788 / NBRC 109480) TaxID=1150621 RepID=A0AA86DZG0_SULMK|nr:hypothetical protein [Sulfurospirillum multivorans]AHJ12435.1 hypothetical protein SMUL_1170 [Sulfurospirillum multivorans DSM 12446]
MNCFSLLREKFNEKKKLQLEKRRSRAHDVKNDRLRFFHVGFTQVGRSMEKPSLGNLVFIVIDVENFKKALEIELIWTSK